MTSNSAAQGFVARATDRQMAFVQSGSKRNEFFPPLFDGLNDTEIAEIMAKAAVRMFEAGEVIIHAGDTGGNLFLIKAGTVDYYRLSPEGQQILVRSLGPGDYFGLVTMVSKPVGYMGTAETMREAIVYVWERTWIRHFVTKHPTLMENAFRIALQYIELFADRHLALISGDAEDRLRRALARLEIQDGHHHARGLEVDITNERLASLADIGYYTTSRLLSKWQRIGAIQKRRGKIVVLSPEKMLGSAGYLGS